jgi:hypothetical protein
MVAAPHYVMGRSFFSLAVSGGAFLSRGSWELSFCSCKYLDVMGMTYGVSPGPSYLPASIPGVSTALG